MYLVQLGNAINTVNFMVSYLGFAQIKKLLSRYYLYFQIKINSEEFLQSFPQHLISILAEAIALLLAQKQKDVINIKMDQS